MLQEMRRAGEKAFTWSDQKIFTMEPQVNVQNDGILAAKAATIDPLVETVFLRREHTEVKEWSTVASDGSKFLLVLVEEGVKVNTQVQLKMPEKHVLSCIAELI